MVGRTGVAATLSAAVVFTVLVLSNIALQSAALNSSQYASTADSEKRILADAHVLEGTVAYSLMYGAQIALASNAMACSGTSAPPPWLQGLTASQSSAGVTVSGTVAEGGGLPTSDLGLLRPFNGSAPGGLNFTLEISAVADDALSGVEFSETSMAQANMPVRYSAGAQTCRYSSAEMAAALGGAKMVNCTTDALPANISALSDALVARAGSQGFGLRFAYSTYPAASCVVVLTTTVLQSDVKGPGGPFTARWSETVSVATLP